MFGPQKFASIRLTIDKEDDGDDGEEKWKGVWYGWYDVVGWGIFSLHALFPLVSPRLILLSMVQIYLN